MPNPQTNSVVMAILERGEGEAGWRWAKQVGNGDIGNNINNKSKISKRFNRL